MLPCWHSGHSLSSTHCANTTGFRIAPPRTGMLLTESPERSQSQRRGNLLVPPSRQAVEHEIQGTANCFNHSRGSFAALADCMRIDGIPGLHRGIFSARRVHDKCKVFVVFASVPQASLIGSNALFSSLFLGGEDPSPFRTSGTRSNKQCCFLLALLPAQRGSPRGS